MDLLQKSIEYLKSNCPDEFDKLDFINSEWIEANKTLPWVGKLSSDLYRFTICDNCRADDGKLVGTDKCSEALLAINIKSSLFYKKIIICDTNCPIYSKYAKKAHNAEAMSTSGFSNSMLLKRFSNYNAYQKELKAALDTCIHYVDSFKDLYSKGVGLFIHSSTPGNGKSHLSIATALEIYDKYNVLPKYCNVVTLANTYKSKLKDNGFDAFTILPDIYEHSGILVLDDLATEIGTSRVSEMVYSIIHYRYDNSLPTVITSNYSLNQIADRYSGDEGLKIADRIKGRCYQINIIAPSFRDKELELLLKD